MKQFITSDENVVNKYGFRVLTAGIDTSQFERNPLMYYMHNRSLVSPTGNEVIGKWENLQKKGGQLVALPVFDTAEKLAKKIAGKVDRGFLRMASVGIQIIETSSDPKHLLKGQTRPTVTKSLLTEISIADQGANDNALMLYSEDGKVINLSTGDEIPELAELLNQKNPKHETMSHFKTLAVALSLNADATETEVLTAITTLQTKMNTAETNLSTHLDAVKESNKIEATQLVNTAVEALKLVDDAKTNFVKTYEALFVADHDNAKAAILASTPPAAGKSAATAQLGSFMKTIDGINVGTETTLSFDYLQKHDPKKLAELKAAEPEKYQTLVAGYAVGVRYTKPTN